MPYESQQLILRDNLKATNVKSQTLRFYHGYFGDKYLQKRTIFNFFISKPFSLNFLSGVVFLLNQLINVDFFSLVAAFPSIV